MIDRLWTSCMLRAVFIDWVTGQATHWRSMDELLKQLGLTDGEVLLYQVLLERESGSPAELATLARLKRPDTYNKLAELRKRGMVEEFTAPNGRKRYRVEHPQKLQTYLNQQEQRLHAVERQLAAALPNLTSRYQLAANKPGGSYFEGKDGMQRVLDDSLTAVGVIDAYADSEAIEKYAPDADQAHVAKRTKLGKHKRIIVTDNHYNRRYFSGLHSLITEVRYLPDTPVPLNAIMQIYDDTISYVTLSPRSIIGVIIKAPAIAQLHRVLFEFTWRTGKPYSPEARFS